MNACEGLTKRIMKKGSGAQVKLPTFPKSVQKVLKRWLFENIDNPYPC
jgi:hypothetical protein